MHSSTLRDLARHPLVVILTAIVGLGLVVTVTDEDGDGRVDRVVIETQPVVPTTVGVDSTGDGDPNKVIELDREARQVVRVAAAAPERFDMGGGLRGADDTPVAQLEGPLATPNFPGCQTRILPTNWSNRVVPMSQVDGIGLHYTAGPNRAGLSDMDGLTAYASSSSAGVSWHFLIDAEGHCYYQVPLSHKAWTIGNANRETVNIEVIGLGSESTYPAGSAGAKKLRKVVRRLGRVLDIPMRVGALSNCSVTRPGIVTHWQGGACSGGHHDIRPYDLNAVVRRIAKDPCGKKCRAKRRQAALVKKRKAKHAVTHRRYRKAGCRRGLHRTKAKDLTRERCQRLKKKSRNQHRYIRQARRKLREQP